MNYDTFIQRYTDTQKMMLIDKHESSVDSVDLYVAAEEYYHLRYQNALWWSADSSDIVNDIVYACHRYFSRRWMAANPYPD